MDPSTHPTVSQITAALSRLADHLEEPGAGQNFPEPYFTFTLRQAMSRLEVYIPGLDPQPEPVLAQTAIIEAGHRLDRDEPRRALIVALRGLPGAPFHPHLWYLMASACFELGDLPDALRCLYHTLWIHPGHQLARTDLHALNAFIEDCDRED